MIARERFLAAVPPANFKPISPVIAVSVHEPYPSHTPPLGKRTERADCHRPLQALTRLTIFEIERSDIRVICAKLIWNWYEGLLMKLFYIIIR